MKRIYFLILVLFFLSGFSNPALAQATLSIQSSSSAVIGNTVSVNVNATGIVDMVGFQFSIAYDNTKLTYLNCSDWSGGASGLQVLINDIPAQGKIAFVYNDAAVNITNGLFFRINFTVVGCPSSVSWSDSPTPRELSNSIPDIINCTYTNGTISCTSIQPPVINTHPNSFVKCPGESVTFTAGATGTGTLSYQWQKNGVNVSTGTGGNTNTYTLTNLTAADAANSPGYVCMVTNAGGTTASNAGTLTISPLPGTAGNITGPSSVTQGQSYSYSVGTIVNATSYFWNYTGTGASITGSGTSVTISFSLTATSGSLFVKGVNNCGDGSPSSPFSVTIAGNPPIINTHPTNATKCVGNSVTFSVSATGQGTLSYQWQKNGVNVTNGTGGNTNTFTINSVSIADAASSPGYVCVVTNSGGSVTSNAATLTVNALPTVTLGPFSSVCISSPEIQLSTGLPAGGTYYGNGVTGSIFYPSVAGNGTHSITYYYTAANGCSNSASQFITVNSLPTITWNGTLAPQCVYNTIYTLSGALPAGGTYSGSGISGNNFNAAAAGPGMHTLSYFYMNANGCLNSITKSIEVVALPAIDAGPDQTITPPASATLTAIGPANNSYIWSTGETTQSITVTPFETTTFYVTAFNSTGCSASDSVTVNVQGTNPVIARLPIMTTCPGSLVVPIMVENFTSVASISQKFEYNPNVLTYTGYQNTHPSLAPGMLVVNAVNNMVQIAWFSLVPATIANDTLMDILFTGSSGTSSLNWELTTPGNCQFLDLNNLILQAQFINGQVTVGTCSNLSGTLTYKNTASTPIANATVKLKQNGILITQTTTASNGTYLFENLANGTYTLETVINKPWGGVNSGDALLVLKHFVGVITLTGLNVTAADVDGSSYVNSGDAMLIAKRFVGMVTSFTAGDWCTEKPTVIVTGSGNITKNLKTLCYGDVDGSFTPAAKENASVMLIPDDRIPETINGEYAIPFNAMNDLSIGSLSLQITLPEGFTTQNVLIPSKDPALYHQTGTQLRISWYSLNPMKIQPGETVFTLVGSGEDFQPKHFSVLADPESEITDEAAVPIFLSKLSYPAGELRRDEMVVWPCPATDLIQVLFPSKPGNSFSLRLISITGEIILQKDGISKNASTQQEINTNNFPPGIYVLEIKENGNFLVHHKRIILK